MRYVVWEVHAKKTLVNKHDAEHLFDESLASGCEASMSTIVIITANHGEQRREVVEVKDIREAPHV